jgi:hypothetical protein
MKEHAWKLDPEFLLSQINRMATFPKFPSVTEGMSEETIMIILQDLAIMLDQACINEDHVEATIDEWKYANHFFPGDDELREVAWSIRHKYQPEFKPREEKASPMEMTPELRAAWDKAVEAVEQQKIMWAAIKRELRITDFSKVSWIQIAECKQRLGYPLNRADQDALSIRRERPAAWDQKPNGEPVPPQPQKLITAEDFDRARNEYERKKFSGGES